MQISVTPKSYLSGALLFAFLFVSVFALPSVATHQHEHSPISNCPFMIGETMLCSMSVFDHITWLQAALAALPVEFVVSVLLLLVGTLSLLWLGYLFDPPDSSPPKHALHVVDTPTQSFRVLFLGSVISPRAP